MNDTDKIKQVLSLSRAPSRPYGWLAVAMAIGILAGTGPARAADDSSCAFEEFVRLSNPLVTVVEGPGDVGYEQAVWGSISRSYVNGLEIEISDQTFRMAKK